MKLIDFYSTTCGPCRMMNPIVKSVLSSINEVSLEKIDIDENPEKAKKYDIISIPTFVLEKDDVELSRHTGLIPHPQFEKWIKSVFKL